MPSFDADLTKAERDAILARRYKKRGYGGKKAVYL